jgi:hypothetical protein
MVENGEGVLLPHLLRPAVHPPPRIQAQRGCPSRPPCLCYRLGGALGPPSLSPCPQMFIVGTVHCVLG